MRVFLALCASAALGVVVSATGCDNIYQPGPESGGSKGPEIETTAASGKPASGSASQMAQSTAPPGNMPVTVPTVVDAGTSADASPDR